MLNRTAGSLPDKWHGMTDVEKRYRERYGDNVPIETVATGTPGGICTVDSRASSPLSADESIGTPITGSVVCAATTPARCAAAPAPTMNAFTPRGAASSTSRMTRAGERCADATVISHVMPSSVSTA